MLKIVLLTAGIISAASVAKAECIPTAKLKAENPNTASYVHEAKRGKYAVSVYRKGQSFQELIEVLRDGRCIVSIEPLNSDQFVSRYLEWPEIWVAEEEGEDNEGMEPEEGGEEQALTEDEMFPFLSLEARAIPERLIYKGPVKRPDFKGRDKDFVDFKDDILEGLGQGVNFSGAYRITQIGCGSSCSIAVLSDLRTGKQYNFPHGGEEVGPISLKFSADSSLMISTWRRGDECILESLQFDGQNWVTLANPPLGKADLCYESIDDNIAAYKSRNGAPASKTDQSLKPNVTADARIKPRVSIQSESIVPGAISPKLEDNYEDINVSALTDLYEAGVIIQACRRAGYLDKDILDRLEPAYLQNESEITRRNGQINKDAVLDIAERLSNFHMPFVVASVGNDVQKACDLVVSRFPPNIEQTKRRIKPSLDKLEYSTGGELVLPKNPRM